MNENVDILQNSSPEAPMQLPFGAQIMIEIYTDTPTSLTTNAPDTFSDGVVDDKADVSGD